MQLSDIFLRLGPDNFEQLLRSVSLGRLKTFQMFEPFKTRLHLHKLNSETLRKSAPRQWTRLEEEGNADLATDLAQAILISHMDMIKAVLDELGVPHEDGFFAKDTDVSTYLKDGWQQTAWDKFRGQFPRRHCCSTSTTWLGKWPKPRTCSRPRCKGGASMQPLYEAFRAGERDARKRWSRPIPRWQSSPPRSSATSPLSKNCWPATVRW